MLNVGVIELSNNSWSSILAVRKDIKVRLYLDARKVNSRIIKYVCHLPHIEGILSRLQETDCIPAFEIKYAF